MNLKTIYIFCYCCLCAGITQAQVWQTGTEVLSILPPNFTYNTVCFETPPSAGGDQEVTEIDINCAHELTPQNSHPPYCVSLYTMTGEPLETFEQVSTIELELEEPTIVVVSGHRIGSVENVLSLGVYRPMPDIQVENDCESITFSTAVFYHLNINGENVNSNSKTFLIEDLSDSDVIQSIDFQVELMNSEENNYLNCTELSSLQYSYLPPVALLPADTILCQGTHLSLQTPAHPDYEYEWNTGGEAAQTMISNINQDSAISVLVTNSIGCYEEATILVEVTDVAAQLPNDTIVSSGSLVTLCVLADENTSYQWSNGSTSFCNPIQIDTPTEVWVHIQNEAGCTATDTMMINVSHHEPTVIIEVPQKEKILDEPTPAKTSCNEGIYIPNVLDLSSPAKENRVFQVLSSQEFEQVAIAKIFDRQGSLLVQKQGFSQDLVIWEGSHRGRPVNNGVFAYWMVIETSHDEWITCKGDLTVIGGRK